MYQVCLLLQAATSSANGTSHTLVSVFIPWGVVYLFFCPCQGHNKTKQSPCWRCIWTLGWVLLKGTGNHCQHMFDQWVEGEKWSLQKWCNYSLNQDVPSAVCVCVLSAHISQCLVMLTAAQLLFWERQVGTRPPRQMYIHHIGDLPASVSVPKAPFQ